MPKFGQGAVAAGHDVTAAAAAELLEDGGNAFDAVLAALLTSCVAEPILSSPGGGGFLTARSKGKTRVFDFFAQTPRRKVSAGDIDFREIEVDFGPARQCFHVGLGAAATPGFLPGLFAVHERLGHAPMTRIAEPAIRAAKEGVKVTEFQAYLFGVVDPILNATPGVKKLFSNAKGERLGEGDTFRNERLADAFDAIAREGLRLATHGEIAQAMAKQAEGEGGHLTMDDIRLYDTHLRDPLEARAGNLLVETAPPPSTGGIMVAFGLDALHDVHRRHVPPLEIAQTLLWMNRLRAEHEGDPHALVALREGRLEETKDTPKAYRGTTHVSVVDAKGNAAAATVSNGEGCGALVPGCGFMLNNMLGEEDINPEGFHRWRENTRMSSMMAPTIARYEDGSLAAYGSGGSNRIRSALLQVSLGLGRGLHPEDAVMLPRLHVEGIGDDRKKPAKLSFEDRFDERERKAMVLEFDDTEAWPDANMFFGGVHIARVTDLTENRPQFDGAGDPRRAGAFMKV